MTRAFAYALLSILVGACAIDEGAPETSQAESDLSAAQWHAPVAMNISSYETPSLVYWNNHLTMLIGGLWYTLDGTTWSKSDFSSLNTTGDTSMVVFNGELYAAFTQQAGVGVCKYDSATPTWNGCTWISGYSHTPQLAVLGTNLYLSYSERQGDGTRDRVILDRVDVASHTVIRLWSRLLPANIYSWYSALAAWSGQLHFIWEDGPGWSTPHPMHELTMVPGQTSVVDEDMGMNSYGTISMSVCNGTVHLTHAGDSDQAQTWWAYRSATATSSWSTNVRLAQQGEFPVLGCNVYVQPTMISYIPSAQNKLESSIFQ